MTALILFDFDGTLADTAPDLGAAANRQRVRAGLEPLPLEVLRPYSSAGAAVANATASAWTAANVTTTASGRVTRAAQRSPAANPVSAASPPAAYSGTLSWPVPPAHMTVSEAAQQAAAAATAAVMAAATAFGSDGGARPPLAPRVTGGRRKAAALQDESPTATDALPQKRERRVARKLASPPANPEPEPAPRATRGARAPVARAAVSGSTENENEDGGDSGDSDEVRAHPSLGCSRGPAASHDLIALLRGACAG